MNYTEKSIQEAYCQLISEAEHFIYIENQFFVTMMEYPDVQNGICQALFNRIVRAHANKEVFRVYVLLPLLPAFEGDIGTGGGSALQVVLHWAYLSISKGAHALLPRLAKVVDDPNRYINFCSLRTFDELSGKYVTEEVYIHSKLMIVDDRRCIIGSANINDRSQLGKRDSEVCVVVEDVEFTDSILNGKPFKAGRYCGSLRMHLFKEHLGLLTDPIEDYDVRDVLCDHFYYQVWFTVASRNTKIYEEVFRCYPTDSVTSRDDVPAYQQQIALNELNPIKADEELAKVQGYLVLFPTQFLIKSDLAPAATTKEGLAPVALFV